MRVGEFKMNSERLKEKLKTYKKEDIIITAHANIQAYVREINIEEVKENIINPIKLVYSEQQESKNKNEEKYACYFAYLDNLYHKYAIVLNGKIIIVTIVKINRRWQHLVDKRK